MFKKLGLVFVWFLLTPALLLGSAIYFKQQSDIDKFLSTSVPTALEANSQNNLEGQVLGVQIIDSRPYIVSNFLKKTVLEPYSTAMVETADKYDIDWKLIPAIAMKESTGGNAAPKNSFNAWGFENGKTQFTSWETAIDSVAKTLKTRYIDRGMTTPEEIMAVYAPPQLFNGGKWAKDINYFFSKMESL